MRVSPATAKFKQNLAASIPTQSASVPLCVVTHTPTPGIDDSGSGVDNGRASSFITSVSSPVAAASSSISSTGTMSTRNPTSSNASAISTPAPGHAKRSVNSTNGTSPPLRNAGTSAAEQHGTVDPQIAPQILAQIAHFASSNAASQDWNAGHMNSQMPGTSGMGSFPSSSSMSSQPPPYSGQTTTIGSSGNGAGIKSGGGDVLNSASGVYDDTWTHQAQARAILGNLIGPNGEQLTSTDPYNTTVGRMHLVSINRDLSHLPCDAGFRWGSVTADLRGDLEDIFRSVWRHTLCSSSYIHFYALTHLFVLFSTHRFLNGRSKSL